MSLGTSVFLSSVLIVLVLLYGFTRDRWAWRRIVLIGIAGCVLLVAGGLVGLYLWSEHQESKERREEAARYAVRIGDHLTYVLQKHGQPSAFIPIKHDEPEAGVVMAYRNPFATRRDASYVKLFAFDLDSTLTQIHFVGNAPGVVRNMWTPEDGVTLGTYREEVRRRLGVPCDEKVSETETEMVFPAAAGDVNMRMRLRTAPEQHGVLRFVKIAHGRGRVTSHGWYLGSCPGGG